MFVYDLSILQFGGVPKPLAAAVMAEYCQQRRDWLRSHALSEGISMLQDEVASEGGRWEQQRPFWLEGSVEGKSGVDKKQVTTQRQRTGTPVI